MRLACHNIAYETEHMLLFNTYHTYTLVDFTKTNFYTKMYLHKKLTHTNHTL